VRRHDQKKVPYFFVVFFLGFIIDQCQRDGLQGVRRGRPAPVVFDNGPGGTHFLFRLLFFFTREKGADTSTAIESAEE